MLKGLPATSTVEENAAAGVSVYTFNVTVSPLSSEGVVILPTIVNSNPLTEAFDIESKGDLEYRVSFVFSLSNVQSCRLMFLGLLSTDTTLSHLLIRKELQMQTVVVFGHAVIDMTNE